VLYYQKKDLGQFFTPERVFYGEGRGEAGICLHLPIQGYVAGSAPMEDFLLMLTVANILVEFLLYKRLIRGPEAWDYDAERAGEPYTVCGDNLNSSGIQIFDKSYPGGPKLFIYLDKTFGSNEVAVGWKNQRAGDEKLLGDFERYIKEGLACGAFACSEEQ
jgi:hypothetical protein